MKIIKRIKLWIKKQNEYPIELEPWLISRRDWKRKYLKPYNWLIDIERAGCLVNRRELTNIVE